MASTAGATQLEAACKDACELLQALSVASPPHGGRQDTLERVNKTHPLDKAVLEHCDGLVFLWTVKAGALVAFSHSQGFMVRRLGGGRWTGPCFVTANAVSIGAVVGAEKASTLIAAKSRSLADDLLAGRRQFLEADVSVQAMSAMQAAPETCDLSSNPPGYGDLVYMSVASGLCVDMSLTGGSMTVDEARNAECYGAGVSTHAILNGDAAALAQMAPLYEWLNGLIQEGGGEQGDK